ncbi:MAG: hypothetical protein GY704_05915, partial [Phycisphaeraceae bacterium]|nr:hypothetical protein [Phycisphaeraceae bacterium]
MASKNGKPDTPRPRRRLLRRVLGISGIVLLVLILLPVTLISIRPSREALLRKGLSIADDKLPGELSIADPAWPRLG